MKCKWTFKQQLVEQNNGQQRWDKAYQLLMQLTAPSQDAAPFRAEVVSHLQPHKQWRAAGVIEELMDT